VPGRSHADLPRTSRLPQIAAFLFAFVAIFVHFARDNVRAADAILKPWTEGRLPPFALDSLHGERIDLQHLCAGATLLHFFATWCEPCQVELSALQKLHERFHDGSVKDGSPEDRSLQIIAVDVGEADSRVRRFFAGQPVSFPVLLDRDGAMSKAWQVSVLPTTFLLGGNLVPRFVTEGDVDWAVPDVEANIRRLIRQEGGAGKGACEF
jgi:thiol-disulfide isomerase/thioredoxin